MKIVITVSGSSGAAALAALISATAQLSPDHGGAVGAVMVMAAIAYGRLVNSGPGAPAA